MTEFENIGMCILIIIYGFVFYMAGRANLIDLVMLMIQDKIKELQDRIKDHDNKELQDRIKDHDKVVK